MPNSDTHTVGLGGPDPRLCLYTPQCPPLPEYQHLSGYRAAAAGEIPALIAASGNHWRKIFSIFAKLYGALYLPDKRWQEVRDRHLFSAQSRSAWLPHSQLLPGPQRLHIIGGKDFGSAFGPAHSSRTKLDPEGRLEVSGNCIFTPYLDYRQFPNALIDTLVEHLRDNTTDPSAL